MPIDLGGGTDPTGLQQLVAMVFPLVIGAAILLLVGVAKWGALSRDELAQLSNVRSQLGTISGPTLTIADSEQGSVAERRAEIAALWTEDDPEVDRRGREIAAATLATIQRRVGGVPRVAIQLGVEAILLAAFAALVVVPASAVREGFGLGAGDALSFAAVADAVGTVWTATIDVVGLFPGDALVWALFLTGVLKLYGWLSAHALSVAVVLGVGAVAIAALDRWTDDALDTRLYPNHRRLASRILAGLVGIWLVGTVPTQLGRAAGIGTIGTAIGVVLSLLAVLAAVGVATKSLVAHLTAAVARDGAAALLPVPVEGRGLPLVARYRRAVAAGYLVVRKAAVVLGVLVVPTVLEYVVRAIISGALVAQLLAFAAAPLATKAVVLVATVGVVAVVLQVGRAEWHEVGLALRRAAMREAIRSFVFARAIPGLLIGVLIVGGWAYGLSLPVTLGVALVAGLLAASVWKIWRRLTLRVHRIEYEQPTPTAVSITADVIDVGETAVAVARVNQYTLAWPVTDLDTLVDAVVATTEAIFEDGSAPPRIEREYYDDLQDLGQVDPADTWQDRRSQAAMLFKQAVRAGDDACTTGRRPLADGGSDRVSSSGTDAAAVDERLEAEFDDRIAAAARKVVLREGPVSRGDGVYYWHGSRGKRSR